MKNFIFLLSGTLFCCIMGQAQMPTIQRSNFFRLNKAYPYIHKVYSFPEFYSEGASGANVIWDFSSLDLKKYLCIDTTISIQPKTTPKFLLCGISGKDSADICLVNQSTLFHRSEDYHYYKTDYGSNTLKKVGSDQDNGVNEKINFQYTQSPTFLLMPFSYLSKHIAPFKGKYYDYLSGYHFVNGIDSLLADAYGTLIIDGITYKDCVRLKHKTYTRDSNDVLGIWQGIDEHYIWYSASKDGPILSIHKSWNPSDPKSIFYSVSYYLNARTTTIAGHAEGQYSVYPNPAINELNIRLQSTPTKTMSITLYNLLGQQVLQEQLNAQNNLININGLNSGTYYYKIQDQANEIQSGSILKQ